MSPLEPLSAAVSKVVAEIIGAWTRRVLKRATDITTSGLDRLKLDLEVGLDDYPDNSEDITRENSTLS